MGGFVAEEMLFPVAFARLWLRARRRRKTREEKRCVLWSIALSLSSTIIRSVRGGTAPSPSVAAADGANAAECVLNRFRLRSGGTSIELNWIEIEFYLFIQFVVSWVLLEILLRGEIWVLSAMQPDQRKKVSSFIVYLDEIWELVEMFIDLY